ncbi:MAG: hypothetical protein K6A96_12380 [Prevotella sp.]|nr:hypothetical protein [Prevotella sp.]
MDEITIDELKAIERADKIVKRLSEALYCDAEDDTTDYPTILVALAKFTASVLLAVQEQGKILDIDEDFIRAVVRLKASMGKEMEIQKINEKRDLIKQQIKEKEEKIKENEEKIRENEKKIRENEEKIRETEKKIRDLERKQLETIWRFTTSENDKLN